MKHYQYLMVGGGMAADAAVRGIRETDKEGSIGIISAESDPPYARPPLTKKLWKGQELKRIWRGTERMGADLILNQQVTRLDPLGQRVFAGQEEYTYDRLLLATGGTPNKLAFGSDRVVYFRYLSDYIHLRELTVTGKHFAVIGGGFIGSEIAAALAMNGMQVSLLFPGEAISGKLFPGGLARFINDYYREKGVRVLPGQTPQAIEPHGEQTLVRTSGGEELIVDGVVAGLGIRPNTDLAKEAGIEVDDGILVSSSMQTSIDNIYAAGDVVRFYNPALGKRIRVEHEEHANQSGLAAGKAMAGQPVSYDLLPMAYSDLFELGYESVGELDARLLQVEDWLEPNRKGVVYYLQNGRVRGVLLWDVWGQVNAARALIAEPGPHSAESLKGRIPFDKK